MSLVRWLVSAFAVAVAVSVVPGVGFTGHMNEWLAVGLLSLILAFFNVTLKPVMQILSLPFTVVTFGISLLFVNTFMLYLAKWVSNGLFHVGFVLENFGVAFLAALVISVVTALANFLLVGGRED